MKYDATDWHYWVHGAANQLTISEWFVITLSLVTGWVLTEILKRNLVWKTRKKRPLVTFITFGNLQLSLKIPYIISFVITTVGVVLFWPDDGIVTGWLKIIALACAVGILSPMIYSLIIGVLNKFGLYWVAGLINGQKRIIDKGGPNNFNRRD